MRRDFCPADHNRMHARSLPPSPLRLVHTQHTGDPGPSVFAPFPEHVIERVMAVQPAGVLELACGHGVLTRLLDEHLPATAMIVATDPDATQLRMAQGSLGARGLEWGVVDGVDMPYAENAFDLVVSQF